MSNAIKKNQSPATQVPSTVHRIPSPDSHHQDTQGTILNITDNPAVPYTVTPQPTERATQRLAQVSRVFPVWRLVDPCNRRCAEPSACRVYGGEFWPRRCTQLSRPSFALTSSDE